jgi:hypothetical protein
MDELVRRLRNSGKVVFAAISTDQATANLPPILEVATPGDEVVWLESERARANGLTKGPAQVLAARQIISRIEPLPDDPAQIATLVARISREAPPNRLVGVLNGGTKLMGTGFQAGLGDAPLVYGDIRPSRLVAMPDGAAGVCHTRPYLVAELGLDDVLACTRRARLAGKEGTRFWPCPETLPDDAYGEDGAATVQVHEEWMVYEAAKAAVARGHARYSETLLFGARSLQRWCANLAQRAPEIGRQNPPDPVGHRRQFEGLFNQALNIAEEASRTAGKVEPMPYKIGDRFEAAVARRVRRWLDSHGRAAGVVEALSKVTIAEHGEAAAELDVALVLRGGLILNLECKSWDCDLKDIDGRLWNVENSLGRFTATYVCSPLYSAYAAEDWFRRTYEKTQKIRERKRAWIGFTLPGQPEAFDAGPRAPITCPSFDNRLGQIIADLCMAPG